MNFCGYKIRKITQIQPYYRFIVIFSLLLYRTKNIYIYIFSLEYSGDTKDTISCETGNKNSDDLRAGKSCKFDYKKIYKDTPCTEENDFGYTTDKPCVLLKLNKLIDFVPSGPLKIQCQADVILFLVLVPSFFRDLPCNGQNLISFTFLLQPFQAIRVIS